MSLAKGARAHATAAADRSDCVVLSRSECLGVAPARPSPAGRRVRPSLPPFVPACCSLPLVPPFRSPRAATLLCPRMRRVRPCTCGARDCARRSAPAEFPRLDAVSDGQRKRRQQRGKQGVPPDSCALSATCRQPSASTDPSSRPLSLSLCSRALQNGRPGGDAQHPAPERQRTPGPLPAPHLRPAADRYRRAITTPIITSSERYSPARDDAGLRRRRSFLLPLSLPSRLRRPPRLRR